MQVSGNGSYWDKLTEEFSYFWSFKNYFSILWEAFDDKFIKKVTSLLGILTSFTFSTRACRTVDFILSFHEFSLSLIEYLLSIIEKLLKLSEFIIFHSSRSEISFKELATVFASLKALWQKKRKLNQTLRFISQYY